MTCTKHTIHLYVQCAVVPAITYFHRPMAQAWPDPGSICVSVALLSTQRRLDAVTRLGENSLASAVSLMVSFRSDISQKVVHLILASADKTALGYGLGPRQYPFALQIKRRVLPQFLGLGLGGMVAITVATASWRRFNRQELAIFSSPFTGDYSIPVLAEKDGEYKVYAQAFPLPLAPTGPPFPEPLLLLPPLAESLQPPLVVGAPVPGGVSAQLPTGSQFLPTPSQTFIEISVGAPAAPGVPFIVIPPSPTPAVPPAPALAISGSVFSLIVSTRWPTNTTSSIVFRVISAGTPYRLPRCRARRAWQERARPALMAWLTPQTDHTVGCPFLSCPAS